ncbi:MAG: DUF2062 domain-containing protein [Desulfobacterales bacterium]
MSIHKIALCLAMGATLGVFPVLGITTLLCTVAAFVFRLNLPAIQMVNYLVYPVQLALLTPFYSIGSWLFKQESWLTPGENLITLIKNDFWGSMTSLWNLTLYAIFTWMVICPILVLVLYMILKPMIGSFSALRKQQSS